MIPLIMIMLTLTVEVGEVIRDGEDEFTGEMEYMSIIHHEPDHTLFVNYSEKKWTLLFVTTRDKSLEADTLSFRIDDEDPEKHKIFAIEEPEEKDDGKIFEGFAWSVDEEMLSRLAGSELLRYRIDGKRRDDVRQLTEEGRKAIRKALETVRKQES